MRAHNTRKTLAPPQRRARYVHELIGEIVTGISILLLVAIVYTAHQSRRDTRDINEIISRIDNELDAIDEILARLEGIAALHESEWDPLPVYIATGEESYRSRENKVCVSLHSNPDSIACRDGTLRPFEFEIQFF